MVSVPSRAGCLILELLLAVLFILTGYIENVFGVFLGILMNFVFPAPIVDGFRRHYVHDTQRYERVGFSF